MPSHTHNQPRNNGDNNQPRGHMVEIPKVSKVEIVRETGATVGPDDPGHITGR